MAECEWCRKSDTQPLTDPQLVSDLDTKMEQQTDAEVCHKDPDAESDTEIKPTVDRSKQAYVGETSRVLRARVVEHLKNAENLKFDSFIIQQAWACLQLTCKNSKCVPKT